MGRQSMVTFVVALAGLLAMSNLSASDGPERPVASFRVDTVTEDGWEFHDYSVTDKDLMVLRYKESDGQLTSIKIEYYMNDKATTVSTPEFSIESTDVVGASVAGFGYFGKKYLVVLYYQGGGYYQAVSYSIKKGQLEKNNTYSMSGNVEYYIAVQKSKVYLYSQMSVTALDIKLKNAKTYYVSFFSNGTNTMLGSSMKDSIWLNVMFLPDNEDVYLVDVYKL